MRYDGTNHADYFFPPAGKDGNDVIYGYGGNDTLYGAMRNDKIYAGAGDDFVVGGQGADYIGGGAGNDSLEGASGADRIFGAGGNDKIYDQNPDDSRGGVANYVDGGAGNDTIWFQSGEAHGDDGQDFLGNDVLGKTTLEGGLGADRFQINSIYGDAASTTIVSDFNPWAGDRVNITYGDAYTGERHNGVELLHQLDTNGSGTVGDGDVATALGWAVASAAENTTYVGLSHPTLGHTDDVIAIHGVVGLQDWMV